MRSMIAVIFTLALASSYASVVPYGVGLAGPGNPGALLKGPATSTKLVGPDGSVITAAADAGALAAAPTPGGHVAAAVAAPIVAPIVPAIAPAIIAPVPVLGHGLGGAVIAGPSGTIATNNNLGLRLGLGHGLGVGYGVGYGISHGIGHGLVY